MMPIQLSKYLYCDFLPSLKLIDSMGWSTVLVVDNLNPMEAEWLSNAIHDTGETEANSLCFEYQQEPDISRVKVGRDPLLNFACDNSYRYAMLVGLREDYLFYKDEANRFFLINGTESFLSKAYPCSKDTMELMFMSWADDSFQTDGESQFLLNIWDKYMKRE